MCLVAPRTYEEAFCCTYHHKWCAAFDKNAPCLSWVLRGLAANRGCQHHSAKQLQQRNRSSPLVNSATRETDRQTSHSEPNVRAASPVAFSRAARIRYIIEKGSNGTHVIIYCSLRRQGTPDITCTKPPTHAPRISEKVRKSYIS